MSQHLPKRLVPLLVAAALAASCGSESVVRAGTPAGDSAAPTEAGVTEDGVGEDGETENEVGGTTDSERPPTEEEPRTDNPRTEEPREPEPSVESPGSILSIEPHSELSGLQPVVIDDLTTIDGSTVKARFSGGAEPCAGAKPTVFEEGDVVEVLMEMGMTPEAIYSTCVAEVFDYEMEIPLDAPLADRALEVHPDSRMDTERGATLVQSRDDLENLQPATIEDLTVADDSSTVKVWFTGGLAECYGAKSTATETDSSVEVLLEIGNPPGSGACNDVGIFSVMNVSLSAPLGDRSLATHPDSSVGGPPKSTAEAEAPTFVGLTLDEAKERAADSGLALRVVWIDGVDQIVTQDYSEDRINVAIDDNVVVESYVG